jgi:pSer/pThr/pTyr-binding forkhead associated (FHA) protein
VTDLGSANGTYLNDELLTPQQGRLLKDGDRLTIGPYTLTFRREAPGSRSAQADGSSDVQRASR